MYIESLKTISCERLLQLACQANIQSVQDVDAFVAYAKLPQTILDHIWHQNGNLEIFILEVIMFTRRYWNESQPWLPLYFVLRWFKPIEIVVPIKLLYLMAIDAINQRYPEEWRKFKNIKLYLNPAYEEDIYLFLSQTLDHVTHLTIIDIRDDFVYRDDSLENRLKENHLILFKSLLNLQVVSIENGGRNLFDVFVEGQRGTTQLRLINLLEEFRDGMYFKSRYLSKELTNVHQRNPNGMRPKLEEMLFITNGIHKYRENVYNFIDQSETLLVHHFLENTHLSFIKPKRHFIYNNLSPLRRENWNNLTGLDISVSCLEFAETVKTIGTQIPTLENIRLNSTKQERVLEGPQDIAAIKSLENIANVDLYFGTVSPQCLKAALGLSKTKNLNFRAIHFTELNPLVLKDCFKNAPVPKYHCLLYKDNSKRDLRYWMKCNKYCRNSGHYVGTYANLE